MKSISILGSTGSIGQSTLSVVDSLNDRFVVAGIAAGRHYPVICPHQPAAGGIGAVYGDLATARRLAEAETSLPIHPYLSDDCVEAVLEACRGWAP